MCVKSEGNFLVSLGRFDLEQHWNLLVSCVEIASLVSEALVCEAMAFNTLSNSMFSP